MWTGHPSAIVTELLLTTAFHRRTALVPLHPKSAFWALLESRPFREVNERSILRIQIIVIPVLSACHSIMELASALQTIPLPTISAVILSDIRISFKQSLAARGRTPRSIHAIPLYVLIHHIILVLPIQIAIHENLSLVVAHLYPAVFRRTLDHQISVLDAVLDMRVEALVVVNMRAVQNHNRFWIHIVGADGAFILCEVETHHDLFFWIVLGIPFIEVALILQHVIDVCLEMLAEDLLCIIVFPTVGVFIGGTFNFDDGIVEDIDDVIHRHHA